MSTRSQILLDGHDAVIYRHSDGYPNGPHGVLKTLLPMCKRFMASRGWDEDYMAARIVADQIAHHEKWHRKWIRQSKKDGRPITDPERYRYTGFGVEGYTKETGFHGDIEFLYVVKQDRVEVRQPGDNFWKGDNTIDNTEVLVTVDFDGKDINTGKRANWKKLFK